MTRTACTIVANNYLAFARVLAESFLSYHSGRFVTLVVDKPSTGASYAELPGEVYFASDLEIPRFSSMAFRYDVLELSTAVKPFLLRRLLADGAQQVLYLDPDILVLDSLEPLYELLSTNAVVLTPHLLRPVDDDSLPGEKEILRSGIFNLGFIGVSREAEACGFLTWWGKRMETFCLHDVQSGLFVDQRWLDLASCFFDSIGVVRDSAYNVAYWNVFQRDVRHDASGWTVDGRPLRFFHFSGLELERPHELSKYQNRMILREGHPVLDLVLLYRKLLEQAGYHALRHLPYGYATFDNGSRIHPAMRRALRDQDPEANQFPDPFCTEGDESFWEWLWQPSPASRAGLPRVIVAMTGADSGIADVLPNRLDHDADLLISWLHEEGFEQVGCDELFRLRFKEYLRSSLYNGTVPFDLGMLLSGKTPIALRIIQRSRELELLRLGIDDGTPPLPAAALAIYRERPDLRYSFPDPLDSDRSAFARWLCTYGVLEHGLVVEIVSDTFHCLSADARADVLLFLRTQRSELALALERTMRTSSPRLVDFQELLSELSAPLDELEPSLPRFALEIYEERPELRDAFPDPTGASRIDFGRWLCSHGVVEHGLSVEMVRRTFDELPAAVRNEAFEVLRRSRPGIAIELNRGPVPRQASLTDYLSAAEYMQAPADAGQPPLPRLALEILAARPELGEAMKDPLGVDRERFAVWFCTHGRREYHLDRHSVEPTLEALKAARRREIAAWWALQTETLPE